MHKNTYGAMMREENMHELSRTNKAYTNKISHRLASSLQS